MAMGVSKKDMVMVAVLLAGTLLAVLNQTLLSPALPAIMSSLGVDATTVQWLTSGYSLVEAVIIPLSAYLIGRFSTRQLFITAFAIFTVGSLAAALAPNFWVLLGGRVLQAACTGMAMPMVFTVILLVFPREKRGTAMGVIGLIIGFAPAIGPSLAGLLVDSVGWRWLFGIVTLLSVVVIVLAVAVLRNYGDFKRTTFDKLSVVLSSVGLVCLLYGLSTFASSDNLALTAGLVVVGLVLVGLFVRRQMVLEVPMLQVDILRTRKYATAVVIIVLVQAALMGTGVITPLYIQGILGYSATMSGVAMLPGALIGALMGLVSGRLFDRFGVRRVVIPGVIVAVLGASGLARLGIDSSFINLTITYTVLVVGLQFTMTPLNTWGVNSLDNSVIQHAQGVSNTLNQVAASMGTAMLVSISALAPMVAPEASAFEQSYLGDHMAFSTTFALMCVAGLVILLCVRDKTRQRGAAAVGAEAVGGTAAGVELADYAAGFDGVTVDASMGERLPGASGAGSAADSGSHEDYRVSDVMNREPVCASAYANMAQVIKLMARNDTSGLPVVDRNGALVGFVSDGDVAAYLGRNELSLFDSSLNLYRFIDDTAMSARFSALLGLNVMDIATKRVVSVRDDMPLDAAVHVLAERRIKKVPVVDGQGRLVGALSRRNIMHAMADALDAAQAAGTQGAMGAAGGAGDAGSLDALGASASKAVGAGEGE